MSTLSTISAFTSTISTFKKGDTSCLKYYFNEISKTKVRTPMFWLSLYEKQRN